MELWKSHIFQHLKYHIKIKPRKTMWRNKTLRIKFLNFRKTSVSFNLSINRNIKHKINLFKASFKASKFSLKCKINLQSFGIIRRMYISKYATHIFFDVELVKYRTEYFIMVFDSFDANMEHILKVWSNLAHTMRFET